VNRGGIMVGADLDYVRRLIADRLIAGPVLELGTGYGGATTREVMTAAGLTHYGTDLEAGPGVDVAADFEKAEDMAAFRSVGRFGTVLVLNVLEHTFDPIRVLDNAVSLLRPGGVLVALTPSVWPLHNYPMDAWRVLPNFYEQYAKRRSHELLEPYFEYVGFGPVARFANPDGSYAYPPPCPPGFRRTLSRVVHRAFNTFGRGMFMPSNVAVAAAFRVRSDRPDSDG
jgi:SAM-dependent methyltransferase